MFVPPPAPKSLSVGLNILDMLPMHVATCIDFQKMHLYGNRLDLTHLHFQRLQVIWSQLQVLIRPKGHLNLDHVAWDGYLPIRKLSQGPQLLLVWGFPVRLFKVPMKRFRRAQNERGCPACGTGGVRTSSWWSLAALLTRNSGAEGAIVELSLSLQSPWWKVIWSIVRVSTWLFVEIGAAHVDECFEVAAVWKFGCCIGLT